MFEDPKAHGFARTQGLLDELGDFDWDAARELEEVLGWKGMTEEDRKILRMRINRYTEEATMFSHRDLTLECQNLTIIVSTGATRTLRFKRDIPASLGVLPQELLALLPPSFQVESGPGAVICFDWIINLLYKHEVLPVSKGGKGKKEEAAADRGSAEAAAAAKLREVEDALVALEEEMEEGEEAEEQLVVVEEEDEEVQQLPTDKKKVRHSLVLWAFKRTEPW